MPKYTFSCEFCGYFEIICSMAEVKESMPCPHCIHGIANRELMLDARTVNGQTDLDTPKTLGALAEKNSARMSEDQKQSLYEKHHSHLEKSPSVALPKGMQRIEKPRKSYDGRFLN